MSSPYNLGVDDSDIDDDREYVPPTDEDEDDGHWMDDEEDEEDEDLDDALEDTFMTAVEEANDGLASDAPTPSSNADTEEPSVSLQSLLQDVINRSGGVMPASFQRMLRARGIRIVMRQADGSLADPDEEEDENDDDEESASPYNLRGRGGRASGARDDWNKPRSEPEEAGLALLHSGEFGRLRLAYEREKLVPARSLGKRLRDARLQHRRTPREDIAQDIVPNTAGTVVATYDSNPYAGQFSLDSDFYYTCVQNFRIHLYDTTAPIRPRVPGQQLAGDIYEDNDGYRHSTTMKPKKTIQGRHGNWTITDSHLSPDNERMIYSSMNPRIQMAKTNDDSNEQVVIDLSDSGSGSGRRSRNPWGDHDSFALYACRFSADGNEIVAGGHGSIFVYDLQAMQRSVRIEGHDDDVNSCCWADTASGNVLVSASDDSFLKVWDRRSLGSSYDTKPAGVLVGHTEGLTYVSPKGDGRYIVSNGKDQTARLWDLRKMKSHSDWKSMPRRTYGDPNFDYRNGYFDKPRYADHPDNCSVMTFRGHAVFRTLIRCHFSPAETTGGNYVYTGSADGRIHIYSLDGRTVQVLDRPKALPMVHDPSESEPPLSGRTAANRGGTRRRQLFSSMPRAGVVRDVSWHGREPVLMSVAWGGGDWDDNSQGTVARHEWKGLGRNGFTLEDWVERQKLEADEHSTPKVERKNLPGAFPTDIDD